MATKLQIYDDAHVSNLYVTTHQVFFFFSHFIFGYDLVNMMCIAYEWAKMFEQRASYILLNKIIELHWVHCVSLYVFIQCFVSLWSVKNMMQNPFANVCIILALKLMFKLCKNVHHRLKIHASSFQSRILLCEYGYACVFVCVFW